MILTILSLPKTLGLSLSSQDDLNFDDSFCICVCIGNRTRVRGNDDPIQEEEFDFSQKITMISNLGSVSDENQNEIEYFSLGSSDFADH